MSSVSRPEGKIATIDQHGSHRLISRDGRFAVIECRNGNVYGLSGGDRPPIPLDGRTVIVVDDGIATGGTVKAALHGLARHQPARLVLAVPVAPADSLRELAAECDDLVCLATPEPFYAVGPHYRDFRQTDDAEVVRLLAEARQGSPAEPAASQPAR